MQTLQFSLYGIIFFLFILTSTVQPCMAAIPNPQQNHPGDLSALLAFKSHITSDPHNILTNKWTTNTSFCNWTGVSCSRRRPRVIALELVGQSLSGNIAPEIGNLTFLKSLNLTNNSFNGHLPDSFGNLWRLKSLVIQTNMLDGPIPPSIFNISSLETISLAENTLSGEIPSIHPPHLKILFLYKNQLEGPIPPTIFHISSLERLSLSVNKLTGTIPASIGNLTQLNMLELSVNNLTGDVVPASFGHLTNLQYLNLRENSFKEGPMPSTILNMSSLIMLDLSSTSLSGSLPSDFGLNFPALKKLFVTGNRLTGSIPNSLSNASSLSHVEFSNNMFTGSVPASIGDLSLLFCLDLKGNQLTGGLGFISSLLNLAYFESLNLYDNPLSGFLPGLHLGNISTSFHTIDAQRCFITGSLTGTFLSNISSLVYLNLGHNNLTGSIPSEIKYMDKLEILHLHENRLEGSIPAEIFQSKLHLFSLSLGQNMLSGPIPSNIGNLTNLQHFWVNENSLSSTIPLSILGLKQLISLDLSFNFLEGHLPREVRNLNFLTDMDLSSNHLSGFLPSTLGELQMMADLRLSNNSFSGPIPQKISSLISLNLLDLSSNSLSGEIPISLANLKHLTFLNLSFNMLEGKVPNGGVFTNLTAQSLIGNPALCGVAKLGLPPCKTSNAKRSKTATVVLKYVLPSLMFCTVVVVSMLYLIRKSRRPISIGHRPSMVHQRFISKREIVRATNNFDDANLLGIGTFGSVYQGQLEDGMIVAIKVLKLGSSEIASKRFEAECEVMRNVRHRNLVKIISSCSTEDFKALILQYMPNKSLDRWLNNSKEHNLDILERVAIVSDVASALEYLHQGCSWPVVHSDVKPSNILLDEDMVAHLGDFGIAKLLTGDNKSLTPSSTLGTIGYIAPEYGVSGKASIEGDVYSFGILLLVAFTGRKPTDAMFTNGSSIREWVKEAFHGATLQIIDPNLLRDKDGKIVHPYNNDNDNNKDIELGVVQSHYKCLSSVLELGLLCSTETPSERMNMKDVVVRLNKIKMELMAHVSLSN